MGKSKIILVFGQHGQYYSHFVAYSVFKCFTLASKAVKKLVSSLNIPYKNHFIGKVVLLKSVSILADVHCAVSVEMNENECVSVYENRERKRDESDLFHSLPDCILWLGSIDQVFPPKGFELTEFGLGGNVSLCVYL